MGSSKRIMVRCDMMKELGCWTATDICPTQERKLGRVSYSQSGEGKLQGSAPGIKYR